MLKTIWTAIKVIVLVFFLMVLHYVLPQHDVGRITSTEVIRTDFNGMNRLFYAQADSGASELATRDLRLINAEIKKTWDLISQLEKKITTDITERKKIMQAEVKQIEKDLTESRKIIDSY